MRKITTLAYKAGKHQNVYIVLLTESTRWLFRSFERQTVLGVFTNKKEVAEFLEDYGISESIQNN